MWAPLTRGDSSPNHKVSSLARSLGSAFITHSALVTWTHFRSDLRQRLGSPG